MRVPVLVLSVAATLFGAANARAQFTYIDGRSFFEGYLTYSSSSSPESYLWDGGYPPPNPSYPAFSCTLPPTNYATDDGNTGLVPGRSLAPRPR